MKAQRGAEGSRKPERISLGGGRRERRGRGAAKMGGFVSPWQGGGLPKATTSEGSIRDLEKKEGVGRSPERRRGPTRFASAPCKEVFPVGECEFKQDAHHVAANG